MHGVSHILRLKRAMHMGNSLEVAPLASAEKRRPFSDMLGFQGWSLLILVGWLYAAILYRLVLQWIRDPNFSHGIFVPAFVLFILWRDRQRLQNVPSTPSWAGLPIIAISLILLVFGVVGVELFTARLSLVILLSGLIIQFRGWGMFRAVLFPWAVLILMIPLPVLIMQKVTFPLQMFASKLSTSMLELVGVPVLRLGNVIVLAAMPLEVAQACSGIRSLLSLVTLAIIYGYLMEKRIWVRVALACSAVPIAVFANSFRIFGTGLLVQYWDPDKAQGFFHEFQGWLIFVVSLALLFTLHRIINLIWKIRPESKVESQPRAGTGRLEAEKAATALPGTNWSPRFLLPALLLLATATGLQAHSQDEVLYHVGTLPMQIGGWTGTNEPIDDESLEILGHGEFIERAYEETQHPQPDIDLLIAYYPTQKFGDSPHSPNHCLPGAGWAASQWQIVQVTNPDGSQFPVNRFVATLGAERQIVLYWYLAHGRGVASDYAEKYYLIRDSIHMHRSDGALIRLMSPMYKGESAEDAQARVMKFGNSFLPALNDYIPR